MGAAVITALRVLPRRRSLELDLVRWQGTRPRIDELQVVLVRSRDRVLIKETRRLQL